MSNHVLILFGVFLVLFLLQSAGGIFQIKDYDLVLLFHNISHQIIL